jgi:Raf kinase inhibitor-like YbhB/YbcL family protein
MEWRTLAITAAVGIGLAGLVACTAEPSVEESSVAGMTLRSAAFEDGGSIPSHNTCDGADSSPALAWDGAPEGTEAFVVLVTDPDAGGFVHWVLADIGGGVRELPEGGGDAMATPGANNFRGNGWSGPCPPSGEHRYEFRLYALSQPTGVEQGASADEVRAAMEGRVLGEALLTGVYARQ